jgi:hypothetical protein
VWAAFCTKLAFRPREEKEGLPRGNVIYAGPKSLRGKSYLSALGGNIFSLCGADEMQKEKMLSGRRLIEMVKSETDYDAVSTFHRIDH